MIDIVLPLILVGLGSAGLLVLRDGRLLVGALLVQWLGLIVAVASGGMGSHALVELATALACCAVLLLTLLARPGDRRAGRARITRGTIAGTPDDLWPLTVAVAGAIGGLALARLYPIGGNEGLMVAFYWTVLSAVLMLVLDGARDPVKLAAGTLALLNSVAFLLSLAVGDGAGPVALGLLAACRIALSLLMAYAWALLGALFGSLSLTPLFDVRGPTVPDESPAAEVPPDEAPAGQPPIYDLPPAGSEAFPEEIEVESDEAEDDLDDELEDEEWLRRITRATDGRGRGDGSNE